MVNAPAGQYPFNQPFPDATLPDDGGSLRDSLGPVTPPGIYLRRYSPRSIFMLILGVLSVVTLAVLLLAAPSEKSARLPLVVEARK